jgi:protein gp37
VWPHDRRDAAVVESGALVVLRRMEETAVSDATGIQWTDSTWNVVTGCTRVSPGCARCYIERTPPFRMQHRRFATVGGESSTGVQLHWDRLAKPPRGPKVFTPSLGDLFHEQVPFEFLHEAFKAMRRHLDRTFQVLTKRPERARDYFASWTEPLPNVWLGVSIENARYTWRADVLREIPAAVRFISAEPLLGSLFDAGSRARPNGELVRPREVDAPADALQEPGDASDRARDRAPLDLTGIDWVIIGGESGPGARPFHLEHAYEIVQACRDHGVAPFVKQLGAAPIANEETWPASATFSVGSDAVQTSLAAVTLDERPLKLRDRKGGDLDEWPADLRIREFPRTAVLA